MAEGWQGRGGLCGATARSEQPRSDSRTGTHRKFHCDWQSSAAENGEHPPEVRGCREHPRVGIASDPSFPGCLCWVSSLTASLRARCVHFLGG